ncbi:MAG: 1-acyl-sn-glycerol-3-phosphate acyltransferase, partial [Lutibacter sp.]|nr:1-acyl-sn-glycerol-3-phosphate acyltransferase [Lutibacter sp.]
KKGAVIFIANHQNGLIDPLLIATTTHRTVHFLARASAFKKRLARTLLHSIHMLPVYRIRDGIRTLSKNTGIFEKCTEVLKEKGAIGIFAEGEHHLDRRVIPLKKGFARIIRATLLKYPELEIQIVPVGLNFDDPTKFANSASIYYGKPIRANQYIDLQQPEGNFSVIINKVTTALKKITLHIDSEADYNETIEKLEARNVDYLDPYKANALLEDIDNTPAPKHPPTIVPNWWAPILLLAKINSLVPLVTWRFLRKFIEDPAFISTFRFALITTLFPLFYLIQTGIVGWYFGTGTALIYLSFSILSGLIATKTRFGL